MPEWVGIFFAVVSATALVLLGVLVGFWLGVKRLAAKLPTALAQLGPEEAQALSKEIAQERARLRGEAKT